FSGQALSLRAPSPTQKFASRGGLRLVGLFGDNGQTTCQNSLRAGHKQHHSAGRPGVLRGGSVPGRAPPLHADAHAQGAQYQKRKPRLAETNLGTAAVAPPSLKASISGPGWREWLVSKRQKGRESISANRLLTLFVRTIIGVGRWRARRPGA